MACNQCGAFLEENAVYCNKCGARADGKKYCNSCGYLNTDDSIFCSQCGGRIDKKKICTCGVVYEGDFCPICGKKSKKAFSTYKKNKKEQTDVNWGKVSNTLKLVGNGLTMLAVLCSFIFVFCISFNTTGRATSVTIYDYFSIGFRAISEQAQRIPNTTLRAYYNFSGYTYTIIRLCCVIATLITVITFSTIAIVRYVKGWLGKTDKSATKWCVATFISYATGVAFLYALNLYEATYLDLEYSQLSGALVQMSGLTKAGIILGVGFLSLGLGCYFVSKFQRAHILKYIFAVSLTIIASVIFCVIKHAGVSITSPVRIENGTVTSYALVERNPLTFLMNSIASVGVISEEISNVEYLFYLKMSIYAPIFQICVGLLMISIAIALYETLKTLYEDGKFVVGCWVVNVVASVVLLVTAILMHNAINQSSVGYGGLYVVLVILSVVGLVASIVGNKLTKNKVE